MYLLTNIKPAIIADRIPTKTTPCASLPGSTIPKRTAIPARMPMEADIIRSEGPKVFMSFPPATRATIIRAAIKAERMPIPIIPLASSFQGVPAISFTVSANIPIAAATERRAVPALPTFLPAKLVTRTNAVIKAPNSVMTDIPTASSEGSIPPISLITMAKIPNAIASLVKTEPTLSIPFPPKLATRTIAVIIAPTAIMIETPTVA